SRAASRVRGGGGRRPRRRALHALPAGAGARALRRRRLRRARHRRRPRRLVRRRTRPLARGRRLGRARARPLHRLAGGARARRPAPPADGIVTGHTAMANAVPAFLDDHVAAAGGGGARPAVVTADGPTTYGELRALACRTGSWRAGARPRVSRRCRRARPTRCRPRPSTVTPWPSGSTRRARPAGPRRPSTGTATCSPAGITGSTCWARPRRIERSPPP